MYSMLVCSQGSSLIPRLLDGYMHPELLQVVFWSLVIRARRMCTFPFSNFEV
jgi:hypothetical protein